MAIGEALDGANELRKAAAAHDLPFAISEQVYQAVGEVPICEKTISVPGRDRPIAVSKRIGGGLGAGRAFRIAFADPENSAQVAGMIAQRNRQRRQL